MGASGTKEQTLGFPRPAPSSRSSSSPAAATAASNITLPPFVDDRKWCHNTRPPLIEVEYERPQFTVISYNILAPIWSAGRAYLAASALAWPYRFALFAREMKHYQPDILCLQEVEEKMFTDDLQPLMKQMGLVGEFERKTPVGIGGPLDGCAIFYRDAAFTKIERHGIALGEIAGRHTVPKDADIEMKLFWADMRNKDNIAHCIFLEVKGAPTSRVVCVANAHLYWNPSVPHVKTMQTMILLEELHRLAADFTIRSLKSPSLILCGDFNSLAHEQVAPKYGPQPKEGYASGTYELITVGQVGPLHPQHPLSATGIIDRLLREATDRAATDASTTTIPDPVALRRSTSGDGVGGGDAWVRYVHRVRDYDLAPLFKHRCQPLVSPFTPATGGSLQSAYAVAGGEPEFTNWTAGFKGTLDYIFSSDSDWHVRSVLTLPLASSFKLESLPDFDHPSDHLPLVASLMLL